MNEEPANLSLGIDVGGTFTDVVLGGPSVDPVLYKLPSTPSSPAEAVLTGMTRALARGNLQTDRLSFWGHGTTIATNTLLERTGARVGLLTTAGFGDLLEIGRQQRPSLYDLFADKPKPLVPPSRCFEISERLAADGTVVRPVSEPQVREAIHQLRQVGTEALAVCLLHAYGNDQHERRIAEIVQSEWPEVDLSLSVVILPEFREYERLSTTVLNAYLGPMTSRYLTALEDELQKRNLCCTPYVLQSNGHLMTFTAARRQPVRLVASGPSAGVMGAAVLGRTLGFSKMLTLDMGGTSADVAVVKDGEAQVSTVRQFVGHSLKITMVDVLSIGAGGGSVAWVDGGDFLRVGPQSAGAVPGGGHPAMAGKFLRLGYAGNRNRHGLRPDVQGPARTFTPRSHRRAILHPGARSPPMASW
jgi:N-methylhydantoinase A